MPAARTPGYCRQKFEGRADLAYVVIDGKRRWLGKHGSPESHQQYDRLIAEWLVNGRRAPVKPSDKLTVIEVVAEFWKHAQDYFRLPDGKPSPGLDAVRYALRPLKSLYGDLPVSQFTPKKLKVIRERLIAEKLNRSTINGRITVIKRVFAWAVEQEMVSASIHHALITIKGLRKGRSEAKESEPVRPVATEIVEKTRACVSRQIRALIDLQLLTGARPGELVGLTAADLDIRISSSTVIRMCPAATSRSPAASAATASSSPAWSERRSPISRRRGARSIRSASSGYRGSSDRAMTPTDCNPWASAIEAAPITAPSACCAGCR